MGTTQNDLAKLSDDELKAHGQRIDNLLGDVANWGLDKQPAWVENKLQLTNLTPQQRDDLELWREILQGAIERLEESPPPVALPVARGEESGVDLGNGVVYSLGGDEDESEGE